MRRIYPDYAYGPGPREGCWWDETCDLPRFAPLQGEVRAEVAIMGAGFTGLSAAYHLSKAGASVAVIDAHCVGWGASGRNGGFCCLGGGIASDGLLDREFGRDGRLAWRATERAAVDLVEALIESLKIDVDRHSDGETLVAHRARDAEVFPVLAQSIEENYGVTARIEPPTDAGIGGPFHGALTTPIGFALNPRKFLSGLVRACVDQGVQIFDQSAARQISSSGLCTDAGRIVAERVIVATNGYSSENTPAFMAARYMPTQSTVLVTRPLSKQEQEAQGWARFQMAYDTRNLLHYFRLMPDGRFLFGMRGGLLSGARAEARARAAVLRDFRRMFPAWASVDVRHSWSGLVCLARNRMPYVGPLPDAPGVLAGFAYHGNGVAMGTYAGACLAALAQDKSPALFPNAMKRPPARFPLGTWRRVLMAPIYAGFALTDR